MKLTGEQRQEAARLCGEATAGPWIQAPSVEQAANWWGSVPDNAPQAVILAGEPQGSAGTPYAVCCTNDDGDATEDQVRDAAFIANARTTLLAALEDIAELEGKLTLAERDVEQAAIGFSIAVDKLQSDLTASEQRNRDLEAQLEIARKALGRISIHRFLLDCQTDICESCGARAEEPDIIIHASHCAPEIARTVLGSLSGAVHSDTERLDFIEKFRASTELSVLVNYFVFSGTHYADLRSAIDAARGKAPE